MVHALSFPSRLYAAFILAAALAAQAQTAEPPRVDNYGDPLPDGAVARFGTIQFRRPGGFARVPAIAPDGKTFLDVDESLLVRIYDSATGRLLKTTQLPGKRPQQMRFSQNGRVLTGQIWDSQWTYHAWDAESGKEMARWKPPDGFWVFASDISADGEMVALATQGPGPGKLVLWNPGQGAERTIGKETQLAFFSVRFSSDVKRVFSKDGSELSAWDVTSGAELWKHKAVPYRNDIYPSPDGKSLLMWENANGPTLLRLDANTGKPIAADTWPKLTGGENIAVLPDGRVLIGTNPKGARIWDSAAGKEALSLPEMGTWLAVAPDSKSVVGTYQGGGELQRWDLTTGKELWPDKRSLGHIAGVSLLAFDPTARKMATVGDDLTLRIWDAAARQLLHTVQISERYIHVLTFAPDGRHLFLDDQKELLQLEVATGSIVRRLPIPLPEAWANMSGNLISCRLTPDGRQILGLLSASNGLGNVNTGAVLGWDVQAGKLQAGRDEPRIDRLSGHSPDGLLIVTTKGQVLDTGIGRELRQLALMDGWRYGQWSRPPFVFSRDSRLVATGISRVQTKTGRSETFFEGAQVWDALTGQPLPRIAAGELGCIAFSPDGRTLATADWDSLCGWDVATGEQLWKHSLGRVSRSIYAFSFTAHIEFSPDGKTIATAMPDSTVLLWTVPPPRRKPAALATPAENDAAWSALISPQAKTSVAAAWALADAGGEAVSFLRERLKPVKPIPEEKLRQLIGDLGDPVFAKREAATKELTALGERREPALRAALAANPSPEQRNRIEKLLAGPFAVPPESVRFLRAVQALEAIGSPAACELLQDLAKGDATAAETKAAAAALARLGR